MANNPFLMRAWGLAYSVAVHGSSVQGGKERGGGVSAFFFQGAFPLPYCALQLCNPNPKLIQVRVLQARILTKFFVTNHSILHR